MLTRLRFSVALVLFSGCSHISHSGNGVSADPWEYPVKLGASRAQVHEVLGSASRSNQQLEEYPPSGVTVWFDSSDRVTKVGLEGEAGAVYVNASWDAPMPSDHPLAFGLTGHSAEADFRRTLGTPKREIQERAAAARELHLMWKKDGYVVDGLFLGLERDERGRTYPVGSLLWFEVYRAL